VQRNSAAINKLRSFLPASQRGKVAEQEHSVGHTPVQIVGGIVLGVATVLVWNAVFGL
jgi:acid phosphatase family membrane protein YuiD